FEVDRLGFGVARRGQVRRDGHQCDRDGRDAEAGRDADRDEALQERHDPSRLVVCPRQAPARGQPLRCAPMAHPRTFRFGVQLATAKDGAEWAATARRYEDLGFSTVFLPDHFGDQLAPLPAMMAAADATTELRVGALVFDNDYKHPVVLAKEIATVDRLSGGRVEFGLGAGWMTSDYVQAGIPKDRDGVRIARMVEAIDIF